jgi:hypothetical protein
MTPLLSGILSGIIFGAIDVGLMLPMSFPDKQTALIAAFLSRFGIGLVIPLVYLPTWPGWLVGLVFGLVLSLPDAVVTKSYAPILITGMIGGLIIGGITHGWAVRSA